MYICKHVLLKVVVELSIQTTTIIFPWLNKVTLIVATFQ